MSSTHTEPDHSREPQLAAPAFPPAQMPAPEAALPPTPPSMLRLALLSLLVAVLWLGSLWLQAGADNLTFNPYALPVLGWYLLAALLMTLILGALSRPRAGLRWGLAIVLALAPLAILLGIATSQFSTTSAWGTLAGTAMVLAGLFMARRLRRITGARQIAAVLTALLAAGAFLTLNRVLFIEPALWYPALTAPVTESRKLSPAELEALLFSQPARVDQALARLGPRELGPSAYFLGFAGYADEKVFTEEIRFAARAMDQTFGSGQRTLFLLNDVRDRASAPIASVTNLRRSLSALGQQMRVDQDLLILALSSHGDADATLAVSNADLPLHQVNAEDLRSALDSAGIRWRLLIISACYAGSFIDALATDFTAIITAAAPDRTSFGCSNDRDLTYFGEAFYRDALPDTDSTRAAFDQAVKLVTGREQGMGVTPSLPAAYFGSQIEEKLTAIRNDTTLRRSPSPAPGSSP